MRIMNESILENAGLTKLETKVYLALLDLGSATAGPISSRSGVHRRSVYDALDRLTEKGLATSVTVNNRKEYQPVNPKRILGLIHEKQESISSIMPQLTMKFEMAQKKQETFFFKGKEGIKSIFEDQLSVKKPVYVISGSKTVYDMLPYFIRHFDRQRVKNKIKAYILFNDDARPFKPKLTSARYLPNGYGGLAAVNIYGDNVAIILWKKDDPFAVLIRNKDIADSYKKHFDLLWSIAED